MASGFDDVLDPRKLKEFGVGAGTVADVFARVVMAAPDGVPQVDIASGTSLPGLAELPQGSVSRASGLLLQLGLLAKEDRRVERPGRPIIPLRLGPGWALIGVRVQNRRGRPAEVIGTLASLDGMSVDMTERADVRETEDHDALVSKIAKIAQKLANHDDRKILGVGVELSAHVHKGRVTFPTSAGDGFPLGEELSRALSGMATVVENDVNARAALQIWRKDPETGKLHFPQPHFAVVAVFDERVGAALVIDRKVYRGSRGMAGKLGHMTVDHARPRRQRSFQPRTGSSDEADFNDPCLCAGASDPGILAQGPYGHVDTLATPVRMAGELGIGFSQLPEAAQEPGADKAGNITRTGEVFRAAGEALGRGVAAVLNIANPGNLLLLLPPELADPADGTAAAHYIQAVKKTLDEECFSAATTDVQAGRSTLQIEPMDPDDLQEAQPARAAVIDSFIAHARGEDTESLAKITEAG